MSGLKPCRELKWFGVIDRALAASPPKGPLKPFDLNVLGVDSPWKRYQVWLANRFLLCYFWVARKFWPFPPLPLFCKAVCVTRAADVSHVLENRDVFKVPYGPEMEELAGGANFALGEDGAKHDRQRAIIQDILKPDDLSELIEETRRIAQALIDGSGGVIDVMSDLVTRVATETCVRYFGLQADDPDAFAEWALSLSTLLFADPSGNPETRALALNGAARLRAIVDHAIGRSMADRGRGSRTLVDRLVTLQVERSEPKWDEIRAILMGMVVGFIPTTTLGAGRMLEELLRRPREMEQAKQAARDGDRDKLKKILWEAARLNPALQPGPWRYAAREFTLGSGLQRITLKAGDILLVATMSALRDGSRYAWPDCFHIDRKPYPDPDFIFGKGSHACVGWRLAMEQITEIFMALFALPDLRREKGFAGGLAWIGPLPRNLFMRFSRPKAPLTQSMITVFAPVTTGRTADQLNRAIKELGNPATDEAAIGQALAKTGLVHFASMAAIDMGRPGRPKPHLLLELNVDGPIETALEAVDACAGEWLAPIFREALGGDQPLKHLLRRYALKLRTRPWGATGLDFNGTPEFPVSDIERQAKLADFCRAALDHYLKYKDDVGGRALGALNFVRRLINQDRALASEPGERAPGALEGLLQRGAEFTDFLIRPSARKPDFPEWVDPGTWTPLEQVHDFFVVTKDGRRLAWGLLGLGLFFTFINYWYLDATPFRDAGALLLAFLRAVVDLIGSLPHWGAKFGSALAAAIPSFPAALLRFFAGIPGSALALLKGGAAWLAGAVGFVAALPGALLHIVGRAPDWAVRSATSLPAVAARQLASAPHAFGVALAHLAKGGASVLGGALKAVVSFLAKLVISVVCAVVMEGLIVGGGAAWFIICLRNHETADQPDDETPPLAIVEAAAASENPPGYAQNHFMAVTQLKPGLLRRLTLALALYGIRLMVLTRFRKGFVLNMGTIHYAQWFRPPGADKLIFLSNYDGSWESYLEDFIMRAHAGQSAVWSNGVGFPRTEYLIEDGAYDGDRFKRWVRRQQQIAPFWYSRFPSLTTSEIRDNALIHYGLIRARNDTAARAWLSIFGSMQRPEETLETEEIQSLVFNGFGRLPHGACIVAELSPDAARCQAWLREVVAGQQAEPLCFGELPIELPGRDAAAFVAFSAKGLRKLKTPPAHDADWLAAFPGVFNIGMAGRGRTLGDENHEDWRWSDARADCAIFVYGKDSKRRDEAREGHLALLRGHAGQKLAVIDTDPVTSNQKPGEISVEHFGFRDGISQPVISGTQRFAQGCCPRDVVEPGEFVFGYPNNLGYFAPSLTVPAEMDVAGSLPMPIADAEVGADSGTSSDFPDFDALDESYAPRDFGRNGTFLVVRQLAQDVEGFKKFTGKAAEKLRSTYPGLQGRNGGQVDAEWVAAKLVGRWQDGTPLVDLSRSQPGGPGGLPDNDFAFGADDPDGFGCPLGAHIRRSNPRDSLDPGDPLEQAITNRHRLMRRGRSYESGRGGTTEGLLESDKSETAEKGLLFVALCGDLERQFEFIQQTWIASPTFHGLVREPDPLVAQNKPSGSVYTIPRPSGPVVLRDLQSFVTVKAGGYFFLPSRSALRFLAMA